MALVGGLIVLVGPWVALRLGLSRAATSWLTTVGGVIGLIAAAWSAVHGEAATERQEDLQAQLLAKSDEIASLNAALRREVTGGGFASIAVTGNGTVMIRGDPDFPLFDVHVRAFDSFEERKKPRDDDAFDLAKAMSRGRPIGDFRPGEWKVLEGFRIPQDGEPREIYVHFDARHAKWGVERFYRQVDGEWHFAQRVVEHLNIGFPSRWARTLYLSVPDELRSDPEFEQWIEEDRRAREDRLCPSYGFTEPLFFWDEENDRRRRAFAEDSAVQ